MYWLPNMHKIPVGGRFIVGSRNCSTKPLSDMISKVFKMIFNHVESFHRKSLFYTYFKNNLLIKVLSEDMNFVFKSKTRSRIGFSTTSVYWTSKGYGERYFLRQTLIYAVSFLIP